MTDELTNNTRRGRVFVASMNMRGKWAKAPAGALKVNVTSAQSKSSKHRLHFSPMHAPPAGYEAPDGCTYLNFEHFWQGGKVWAGLPAGAAREFFKRAAKPARRLPGSRGMKVLHSHWNIPFLGIHMGYVESRKKVYVPFYHAFMKDCDSLKELRGRVERGGDVVVYDFDGPRLPRGKTDCMDEVALVDGDVACMPVSLDLLRDKINDEEHPFGHGYVVAAAIAGISVDEFTVQK
jgi:hypothetical protein